MLYHLSSIIGHKMNIGHYRDNRLAILKAPSGSETNQIKKQIEKLFKDHNQHITTELGLIQTDFLDVTFNLKSGKYWPYRKPNDQPLLYQCRILSSANNSKTTAQYVVQVII